MQRAPGGAYRPPPRTAPPPPPPPPAPGLANPPDFSGNGAEADPAPQTTDRSAPLQPSVAPHHPRPGLGGGGSGGGGGGGPSGPSGPGPSAGGVSGPSGANNPNASAHDGVPDAPTRFPELDTMSLVELRLLDEEPAKFDDFVLHHAHHRRVDDVVAAVRSDVEAVERDLSARRAPVADAERASVATRIAHLRAEVEQLERARAEWLEANAPERLMERLRTAIREAEAESDRLEQDMLAETLDFEDFLKHYIAVRKKYHERALKLEQLKLEEKRKSSLAR